MILGHAASTEEWENQTKIDTLEKEDLTIRKTICTPQAEEINETTFVNSSGIFSKNSCGITSYCHIIDAHGIDRQAGTCIYAWWYIWTLVAFGSVATVLVCFCVKNIFKH